MSVSRLVAISCVALSVTVRGNVPQQREASVAAAGTGAIAGAVMTAGTNPAPVRRAVVSIAGGGLAASRSAITDDAGRFSFTRLPAGSFRLVARKAAWLDAKYGATRPGQEGAEIALTAGQRVDVTMTMFKGAVLAGVVRDSAGRPLASVPVEAVDLQRRGQISLGGSSVIAYSTDDRGVYRIYGLLPGEYLVSAAPLPGLSGGLSMRSAADTDKLLAALAQKTGAAPAPLAVVDTPARFAPIFHPATPYVAEAARVRVGAGEERTGIDIVLTPARAGTIEGTVSGQVANLKDVEVDLVAFGPRIEAQYDGLTMTPPDASGKFAVHNVPPGRYRLVARAKAGPVNPSDVIERPLTAGGSAGATRNLPTTRQVYVGERLFASADVEMRGQDGGVSLSLQPGGSIAGRVVFEGTAAPVTDLATVRIGMSQAQGPVLEEGRMVRGTSVQSVETVSPRPDATFQLNGIAPARYQLYANLPAAQRGIWTLRSAVVDGRDLLDEVIDGANIRLSGVTLTYSDQPTSLSGTFQSASGQPAAQYFVVVFAADRRFWREGSRRSQSVRPSTDGRFTFPQLPAGDYLLAALTDLEPGEWQRPEFLEQIAGSAIKVSIAWGERKVQDLRIK